MPRSRILSCLAVAALLGGGFSANAGAMRFGPETPVHAIPVNADCHSVGQRVASERGGQLARATPQTQGGQTVCVIVVLVPGKDGERPRRQEVVVPAG